MKRRQSLKILATITVGSTLFGSCTPKNEIWEEGMTMIKMNSTSSSFMGHLSNVIVPQGDMQVTTLEPFSVFVERIVNDMKSPEDITKFGQGFNEYVSFLQTKFNKGMSELSEDETNVLFAAVQDEEAMSDNARAFFDDVRRLSIWHFKSTPEYMEAHTTYELVPARFNGCFDIV